MKKHILTTILLSIILCGNCQTSKSFKKNKVSKQKPSISKVAKGFNQNFSMMPNLTEQMCKNIQKLKPQVLRYPGGTVTHAWNWKEGKIETRASSSIHLIQDVKTLKDSTGAEFIFVLDIMNKPIEDQIDMLRSIEKLGIKINFIELGNELYAQEKEYKNIFPTGKAYADKVNLWIPELRKNFPNAKIASLLLGRKVKIDNTRMYNWNREVVDNTKNVVDAFTYHLYINEKSTFAQEKNDFLEVAKNANTQNKELWFTEYGNKQDKTEQSYYTELNSLADFIENFPNVSIALNHQIVGGTKSKLSEDGSQFNEEGKMFLKRVTNQ